MKQTTGQSSCPNCGGIHFGTKFDNCPYKNLPCVVCGELTIYACSDCAIDTGKAVHVCGKVQCQTVHEKTHETHAVEGGQS